MAVLIGTLYYKMYQIDDHVVPKKELYNETKLQDKEILKEKENYEDK